MRVERVEYVAEGWGVGELVLEDGTVVWHELPRPRRESSRNHPLTGRMAALAERMARYFAGEKLTFADVPLDLDWCTPFQRAVAEALRDVRYGETVTYGELAALAGYPNAQRAAGTFCARNRLPIFVPCHRVVAADGIGPYGSIGVEYKRRLLELEGQGAL